MKKYISIILALLMFFSPSVLAWKRPPACIKACALLKPLKVCNQSDGAKLFNHAFGQAESHCAAAEMIEDSSEKNMIVASIYTGAAAVCAAACAASTGTLGAATVATGYSCTAASLGAAGMDITMQMKLNKKATNWPLHTAAAVAGAGASGVVTYAFQQTIQKAAELTAVEAAKGSSTEFVATSDTTTTAMACASVILLGGIAALRFNNTDNLKNNGKDSCNIVQDIQKDLEANYNKLEVECGLPSIEETQQAALASSTNQSGNTMASTEDGSNSASTGSDNNEVNVNVNVTLDTSGSYGSGSTGTSSDVQTDPSSSSIHATAASDSLGGKLFSRVIDTSKLKSDLRSMNLSIPKIKNKLQTSSPMKILSGISGLSPEMRSALMGMEKETRGKTYASLNLENPLPYTNEKSSNTPRLASDLSLYNDQNRNLTSDTNVNIEPESNDIWHSDCTRCTIFDIVSKKYSKSQDRVEKLDWASRLNKAYFWGSEKQ